MIGKIKGILSEIDGNVGLIETNSGVFYRVYLTPSLISYISIQSPIEIYTYLQVKEDDMILFGFQTKEEHSFFLLLLTVSGVGPKTAHLVISYSKVNDVVAAIKSNDVGFFSQIKGLGKKTAMKIILELSQKLKQEFVLEKMYLSEDDKIVIDALVTLGFNSQEAKKALNKIPKQLTVEEKIREVLKNIK